MISIKVFTYLCLICIAGASVLFIEPLKYDTIWLQVLHVISSLFLAVHVIFALFLGIGIGVVFVALVYQKATDIVGNTYIDWFSGLVIFLLAWWGETIIGTVLLFGILIAKRAASQELREIVIEK